MGSERQSKPDADAWGQTRCGRGSSRFTPSPERAAQRTSSLKASPNTNVADVHSPQMKAPKASVGRKAKRKPNTAKVRRLKHEFDEAHKIGMAGLREGDYAALDKAVAKERVILEEQAELIADSRRAFKEQTRSKRKLGKKR